MITVFDVLGSGARTMRGGPVMLHMKSGMAPTPIAPIGGSRPTPGTSTPTPKTETVPGTAGWTAPPEPPGKGSTAWEKYDIPLKPGMVFR